MEFNLQAMDYNFSFLDGINEIQKDDSLIKSQALTLKELKRKEIFDNKKKNFKELLGVEIPIKNYSYHIVSNGTHDLFTSVPYFIEVLGNIDVFYGSTWATSPSNVKDLLTYFDDGKIGAINILLGDYHKMKSRAEYGQLANGLQSRKQRFAIFNNHVKILLFQKSNNFIVIEISANFTNNPRLEQHVIYNSKDLFDFHKNWMDLILDSKQEFKIN